MRGMRGMHVRHKAMVVEPRRAAYGLNFPREELDCQQHYMTAWL